MADRNITDEKLRIKNRKRYGKKGLSNYFYVVFILVLFVLVVYYLITKKPITTSDFINKMNSLGYTVYDNYNLSSGEKNTEFKVVSFDEFFIPAAKYTATHEGRTEAVFMIFTSEENAVHAEKIYENDQLVKINGVNNLSKLRMNINNTKSNKTQKGVNYKRSYVETLSGGYALVSQVGNTLLVAYVDEKDIDEFNWVISLIKY